MHFYYFINPCRQMHYVHEWKGLCRALDTEDKFLQLSRFCKDGLRPYIRFQSCASSTRGKTNKWLEFLFRKVLHKNKLIVPLAVVKHVETFLRVHLFLLFKHIYQPEKADDEETREMFQRTLEHAVMEAD